jgi:TRAP-type uncharacterized transport system substrate-binding protein
MWLGGKYLRLRDYLIIGLPATALVIAAFWASFQFVQPAPPNRIVVAAASKGSPYYKLAERYQKILASEGVNLQIRESEGSFDNLKMLNDPNSAVQAAFVQGGLATAGEAPRASSLGRVLHEPLWIFCRAGLNVARLTDLKGRRVMVGPGASGTSRLASKLLAVSGVTAGNATLINRPLPEYEGAFDNGEADAGFLSLGVEAVSVQRLLADPNVRLVSLTQSDAYLQRFPFLTRLELKEGVVDFDKNIPPSDAVLLATTAAFLVRDDLHPTLVNLLAQTLVQAHSTPLVDSNGEAPVFERAGQFPAASDPEFPMAEEARRVYRNGPPLLQRYLPFWAATLADRLMVMVLPVIGILLPVGKLAPMVYTWRVRRRILRWYRELKKVEAGIGSRLEPGEATAKLAQVEDIEDAVNQLPVPLDFASQLYDLREHIDVVRRRLTARSAS